MPTKAGDRVNTDRRDAMPHTLPEMGNTLAYNANRDGVAERFPDPAVHKSIAVDLALSGPDDPRRRAMALSVLHTATQHDANRRSLLRTVPGIGAILRVVLLSAIHDSPRCPRGQDGVSSCRLVKCAKASAGKRSGTSGTTSGHASRTWAFSEAAVCCLRNHPPEPTSLARLEKKHGKGKALTVRAPQLARAVSSMFQRATACDRQPLLQSSSGAERRSPTPNWPMTGCAWRACSVMAVALRRERLSAHRPWTLRPTLGLDLRAGSALYGASRVGLTCAAPPPILGRTGVRLPLSRLFA